MPASWIQKIFNDHVTAKRNYYDDEIRRRGGQILKNDASYKQALRLMKVGDGEPMFNGGCMSITNEYGEIRGQYLCQTSSHEQLIEPLKRYLFT